MLHGMDHREGIRINESSLSGKRRAAAPAVKVRGGGLFRFFHDVKGGTN